MKWKRVQVPNPNPYPFWRLEDDAGVKAEIMNEADGTFMLVWVNGESLCTSLHKTRIEAQAAGLEKFGQPQLFQQAAQQNVAPDRLPKTA